MTDLMQIKTAAVTLMIVLFQVVVAVTQDDVTTVNEISLSTWQQAYNENQKLLVFFYQTEGCEQCSQALEKLTHMFGQPEIPTGVNIVKSADLNLISKVGIKEFPALVYLRDKAHVKYDGNFDLEDLLEWTQLASQRVTQRLDDATFEHLTQASSGATTGDWLVVLDSCKHVLPVLESLGIRHRGRLNVAKVNIHENPALVERFRVTECPHILYFRQGKMYRYELPVLDVASLRSFVDGFYKNVQAHAVPIPKSQFDFLTETIADKIKSQLKGENESLIIIFCGLLLTFAGIIFCCCRSVVSVGNKHKTD